MTVNCSFSDPDGLLGLGHLHHHTTFGLSNCERVRLASFRYQNRFRRLFSQLFQYRCRKGRNVEAASVPHSEERFEVSNYEHRFCRCANDPKATGILAWYQPASTICSFKLIVKFGQRQSFFVVAALCLYQGKSSGPGFAEVMGVQTFQIETQFPQALLKSVFLTKILYMSDQRAEGLDRHLLGCEFGLSSDLPLDCAPRRGSRYQRNKGARKRSTKAKPIGDLDRFRREKNGDACRQQDRKHRCQRQQSDGPQALIKLPHICKMPLSPRDVEGFVA